jgi:hypothetical protein
MSACTDRAAVYPGDEQGTDALLLLVTETTPHRQRAERWLNWNPGRIDTTAIPHPDQEPEQNQL